MKEKMIKGSAMILAALEKEGVEIIFGFPGGAVLPLYDQLYDAPIKHLLVRHEQAAVHAADGYARVTGRPGVVFATSGPGATNLVTGIANAYMDSVPLVLITGQVASAFIGTDAFQEADITGITLPVTKHSYLVKDIEELPGVLAEAFYIASTGRQGPVLIDIPKDVFDQEAPFIYNQKCDIAGYKPTYEGHAGQISRAVKAIRDARRPVIFG
ncbi:MAG: thiamine pyrophosphate-binding protein, partial [Clostridia bacterium]|nr:thiamine pyrophosphate-binding protein [Clostridia bacterium]